MILKNLFQQNKYEFLTLDTIETLNTKDYKFI